MEQKVNPWKANLNNGLILAMAGIVYTLVMYFLDLTVNKTQGYTFIAIEVALLYFLIKSYRDNYLHGQITYGQSILAGVIISLYYAIGVAIFTYILYKFIDPGLVEKQLAMSEEALLKRGTPEAAVETAMNFTKKFMKPEVMAPSSIIGNMIWGTILSLIVGIFVRKEGNPLLDDQVN